VKHQIQLRHDRPTFASFDQILPYVETDTRQGHSKLIWNANIKPYVTLAVASTGSGSVSRKRSVYHVEVNYRLTAMRSEK